MSAIHKLSIQGIRSFDSNDRETIEFGKPLNLIVGTNGSGKTTIIECLKYATTGDLPPNSKGGVFVHDPKITGEKDVRAQVKLAFTSTNGLNMIVTRNIQLLAKKNTNTFKTLEGQLVAINRNGDRSTLSTKSMELDSQVPLYLGVPKAILDYVIFCHQEDSLWPLSEPANLKKKFDEIFQALKFTKAIDNLKSIKKDMAVDIKLLKQSVEHLKIDRDRSKSTKMKKHQLEAKIDEYQQQVNKIEKEIQTITTKADKLFKSNQDFQEILSKMDNLVNLKKITGDEITRLSSNIEIIDLPLNGLNDLLQNFAKSLEEKEFEIKNFEDKLAYLRQTFNGLNKDRENLIRLEADLKVQKNNYIQLKHKIDQSVEDISTKYQIDNNNALTSLNCLKFLNNLKTEQSQELENYQNNSRDKLKELENIISKQVYKETVQSQNLEYYIKDCNKLKKDIENFKIEVDVTDIDEKDLEAERMELNNHKEKLIAIENENYDSIIDTALKNKNDEIMQNENKLEEIQNKILKTNQQADLFAKLGFVKKSLNEKNETLTKLKKDLNDDFKFNEFNLKIDNDTDIEFKTFFISIQKNIALSNKDLNNIQQKYSESNFHLSSLKSNLNDNIKLINDLNEKLKEEFPEDCDVDTYYEVLSEAELSYKTAVENLKMHQTTLQFNKKALEVAENTDCCYLCSRKFENNDFKGKLLDEIRKRTDANFEITLKDTVEEEMNYLNALRKLEKDVVLLKGTKEKTEVVKTEIAKQELEVEKLKHQLTQVEEKNQKLKDDRDYCDRNLRLSIEQILILDKDCKKLASDSKKISEELKSYNDDEDGVKTVDELRESQKQINERLRQLRKEISNLQDEREEKRKKHSFLVSVVDKKTLGLREMENILNRIRTVEIEIKTRTNEVKDIEAKIDALKTEVIDLKNKRTELESSFKEEQVDVQANVDVRTKKLDSISKDLKDLVVNVNKAEEFEQNGFSNLEKCSEELRATEKSINELNEDIEIKTTQLNEQKQKFRDSNNEKRNLNDNIELHNLKNKLKGIINEIDQLDIHNAAAQRDEYQKESAKLRNLYERLSAENAGNMGEMRQLQNQIDSLNEQLTSDYKDIDLRYQKEWIELQTRTFVTDDIDTYAKVLDSAIMRYHSLKMEDINRIIDELWKKTYSGTDIDTIKIRSDEVTSTARGKSYNYRVVMFKQDAELDMRGRCSAGQKVLASIIIRLALSETFGVNCGVIALDEPTTNLDEENIESLAKSLNNIIQFRKKQKNFQLIVITHDEKFLSHMNAVQFTDHFFKVKRDDRQKSQIEWVDINRVND